MNYSTAKEKMLTIKTNEVSNPFRCYKFHN